MKISICHSCLPVPCIMSMSLPMSVVNLCSAESWSISIALCVFNNSQIIPYKYSFLKLSEPTEIQPESICGERFTVDFVHRLWKSYGTRLRYRKRDVRQFAHVPWCARRRDEQQWPFQRQWRRVLQNQSSSLWACQLAGQHPSFDCFQLHCQTVCQVVTFVSFYEFLSRVRGKQHLTRSGDVPERQEVIIIKLFVTN